MPRDFSISVRFENEGTAGNSLTVNDPLACKIPELSVIPQNRLFRLF